MKRLPRIPDQPTCPQCKEVLQHEHHNVIRGRVVDTYRCKWCGLIAIKDDTKITYHHKS